MTEDEKLIERALSGNRTALEALVRMLTPVIQARSARIFWKYRGSSAPARQDVHDATQDVLAKLFCDNGKILRDWDADRGLSLRNFVGLVASRQVLSALRTNRDLVAVTDEAATLSVVHGELTESRLCDVDLVVKLCERLRSVLSPLGFEVFERLYLRELSTSEIEQELGLSPEAIYQWRTRLRRLARQLLDELESGHVTDASRVSRASNDG